MVPAGVTLTLEGSPLPAPVPSPWSAGSPTGDSAVGPARGRPDPPGVAARARSRSTDDGIASPLFWTVRSTLEFPFGQDGAGELRRAGRAYESALRSSGGNGLRWTATLWAGRWERSGFPVTDRELSHVLPGVDCPAPGADDRSSETAGFLPLGRTESGEVVRVPIEPGQGRHLTILGETGMGKSSLVAALARRARVGAGLVLLDPLGETVVALAASLDSASRADLLRIDPVDHPLRVNALEGVDPAERDPFRAERRLNDLVHALRRVRAGRYVDSGFWGPRLEEILTRSVGAAAALEEGTLSDAHTLLATGARWHRDLPPRAREPVRALADRIRERPEDAEGARRLLFEVVRSPVLERLLCARTPDLAVRDLLAPGRVVLVSGNAARVGESVARYLLAVYLALLWSELLARRPAPKTFVFLDEAQWFSHESLAEMLRLGRRANVHVVLATQAVGSLPESVADAVWTNVADFVAFRGSPEEAREVARMAPEVAADSILALPRGHAVALLGKGHSVRWIRTARTPVGPDLGRPGESASADRPIPPAAPSFPTRPVEVADVIRWLATRVRRDGSPVRVRVSLQDLRRELGASNDVVRAAGGTLGRAGALASVTRQDGTTVWELVSDRIPSDPGDGLPPPPAGPS